jgi:N-acetylglucosaminyldiphosphoundecaprenol N-acetyl-beta-D-mannosaminyltransferase
MHQALEKILALPGGRVAFVNAHCLNVAYHHDPYRQALLGCHLVLADGIGIRLGASYNGVAVQDNVNGTDMFPLLCERLVETGKSLYLLGAAPGIAEGVREWIDKRYSGGVRVVGHHHGYFSKAQESEVMAEIERLQPDLVLVALGVPGQELLVERWQPKLPAQTFVAVGGLFDFYSGRLSRAPLWMRRTGLEWAWRMSLEPGRLWRRYLIGNLVYLWHIWRHAGQDSGRYRSGGL